MQVTQEEAGARAERYKMRFLDAVEEYDEHTGHFSLQPHDKNESPIMVGTQSVRTVRYVGPAHVGRQPQQVRSALLGHQCGKPEGRSGVPHLILDFGRTRWKSWIVAMRTRVPKLWPDE